jgi:hypothetical protein
VIKAGRRERYRGAGATETKKAQSPVNRKNGDFDALSQHEKTITEIATDLVVRSMLRSLAWRPVSLYGKSYIYGGVQANTTSFIRKMVQSCPDRPHSAEPHKRLVAVVRHRPSRPTLSMCCLALRATQPSQKPMLPLRTLHPQCLHPATCSTVCGCCCPPSHFETSFTLLPTRTVQSV